MQVTTRTFIGMLAALTLIPALATPARAQFEEPDTVGGFAIGPFVELLFRGQRGTTVSAGSEISYTGGPGFGLRLEYRLTRTFTLGATASYSNPDEEQVLPNNATIPGEGATHFQFTGEAHLRVKPNIPGYFVLGGGVRRGDPDSGAVHTREFTEPMGILGVGLQFASRRHWAGRLEFRGYFLSPADQPGMDMESLETDFAIGLGVIFRP